MKNRFARITAIIIAVMLWASACAFAQETISTTVLMRVSRMTQRAVVDVGEDLSIEVSIDGVQPSSYQWYFNDARIEGADQKVFNIVNAQVSDSGVYRMDAFDEAGSMLVSMDIAARVIDDVVPQSGDTSLPVGFALAGAAACALLLTLVLRRRLAA